MLSPILRDRKLLNKTQIPKQKGQLSHVPTNSLRDIDSIKFENDGGTI